MSRKKKSHKRVSKKRRVRAVAKIRKHRKSRSHPKKINRKKGTAIMAKRRRHGGSSQHKDQIVVFAGKKHHAKKYRRHSLRGDGLMSNIGGNAINVLAGVAGATVGSFAGNMIPAPSKIKAMIPILLGIVVSSSTKIPAVRYAGLGIAIMGGLSLINQVMPKGLPMISGDLVDIALLTQQPRSVSGEQVQIAGAGASASRSGVGWQTAANMR